MKGGTHIDLALARESLALVVLAYTRLMAVALPDTVLSLRYARKLRAHVRRFTRLKLKFIARVRREDLVTYPNLRKQVRFDLGGITAMVKWERRRRETKAMRRAIMIKADDPYAHVPRPAFDRPAAPRVRGVRKPWIPKTDRTNGYRLASIPTGVLETPRAAPKIKTRLVKRTYALRDHPIEVTADELRPDFVFSEAYNLPPTSGSAPSGHSPPIDRPPI